MKRLTLGAVLLLTALQMNAQTNNLTVFDQEGHAFYAILDGVRQNATAQTNVKITGLTSTQYKLRLIFQDTTLPVIDKTIYYQNMGYEEAYHVITKKNGERVLRIESMDPIPSAPPPAPPTQTVIAYNTTPPPPPPPPATSTTIVQQTTTTTTTGDPNQVTSINMNVGGAGVNMNVGGAQQTTVITTTTTSSGTDMNQPPPPVQQAPPPPPPVVGCVPMAENDYESAKSSISAKDFEDTKLSMAKTITGSNNLTAGQVRGIMKLFGFENTKLEFAKFAYDHCCDKSNYYKVDDAFEFDSSTTELNSYISSH